jgi:hypothetical protein
MRIFVNASSGFYDRYHHTVLQPFNPPQAHFLVGQTVSPPPLRTLPHHLLFSKPLTFMFWKHFTVTNQSFAKYLFHRKHFAIYGIFGRSYSCTGAFGIILF